jgi:hypothetical protein
MNENMKDLHGDLANALRREEPPAGFADRVLNRVAEHPSEHSRPGPFRLRARGSFAEGAKAVGPALHGAGDAATRSRLPFVHWAAAAALVAAVAGGFDYIAKQKERAEGEAAKERVVLALHIAGAKLQLVQMKINRMHEPPEKNANQ